jgi:hypothetical protein
MEEHTQLITMDAIYTQIYKKIRNQKGCQQYQNTAQQNAHININDNNLFPPLNPNQPLTQMYSTPQMPYSQAATQNQQPANNNITEPLTIFVKEFKAMFSQLLNQNSMILNMLSTVINKFHYIQMSINKLLPLECQWAVKTN